jgi:hypothetical protein
VGARWRWSPAARGATPLKPFCDSGECSVVRTCELCCVMSLGASARSLQWTLPFDTVFMCVCLRPLPPPRRPRPAPPPLSWSGIFETVVCMEDGPLKPLPDPVLKACAALGVNPAVTPVCMLGDTVDDIKASVAAGVHGIGVLTPGTC